MNAERHISSEGRTIRLFRDVFIKAVGEITKSSKLSAVSVQELLSVAHLKRQEMQWYFDHYQVSTADLEFFDLCMQDYLEALQACAREVAPAQQEEHINACIRQLFY